MDGTSKDAVPYECREDNLDNMKKGAMSSSHLFSSIFLFILNILLLNQKPLLYRGYKPFQ